MKDYQEKIQRQEETAQEVRRKLDEEKSELNTALNRTREELDQVKEEKMKLASS